MLFILSGNIQTGKTRWLERAVRELEAHGVEVCGVLAPGVWVECEDGADAAFEKLGIDNVLLPQWKRIHLATRNDDVLRTGGNASSNKKPGEIHKPKLWEFDDAAMARVNAHFDEIATLTANAPANSDPDSSNPAKRLLVVDEFGQLEVAFGEGLTSAIALIDAGATLAIPHALVVIREQLLDLGLQRFPGNNWGGVQVLAPGDDALAALLAAFE